MKAEYQRRESLGEYVALLQVLIQDAEKLSMECRFSYIFNSYSKKGGAFLLKKPITELCYFGVFSPVVTVQNDRMAWVGRELEDHQVPA